MIERWLLLLLSAVTPATAQADRMDRARLPRDPIAAAAFGQSYNDCEELRQPLVQHIDSNRDGRPDAIVWDRSRCYRKFGGYFVIMTQLNDRWISLAHEIGRPRWLPQRTRGWPDFEVRDISRGNCFNLFRLAGAIYVHAYADETRPEQCYVRNGSRPAGLQPVRP